MNREEIIASIEEKKARLKKRLEVREQLMKEIDVFEEEIAALEDKIDDDLLEYEKLWVDMKHLDDLNKDIAQRKEELVYSSSENYAKWRRFLTRKLHG